MKNITKYNDLISLVVPVYNVEMYLERCIESILNQDYKNLEIILVDDGSTDSSGKICDKYKKRDNRIRVIHKSNGGLSSARNCGIKNAHGVYISFIDSDDWITNDYVSCLYNLSVEYSSDISICKIQNFFEDEQIIANKKEYTNTSYFKIAMNKHDSIKNLLNEKHFSNSACAKLFKSELFNDVYFPEGKLYEDIPTIYKVFMKCNKIAYIDSICYYYLYRLTSISRSKFDSRKMDAIYFIEKMISEVLILYPDLESISNVRLFNVYYALYIICDKKNEYYDIIYQRIKNVRKKVLFSHVSSFKDKMKSFITFLGHSFVIKIEKARRRLT